MARTRENNSDPHTLPSAISVGAIAAFFTGILVTVVAFNYFHTETISISTLDLVNIVFTVVVSTASIVLAITAINLSKKSEEKMLDLFIHSDEILSKIKSSTGVIEKRQEDLMGAVRQAINDVFPDRKTLSDTTRKDLEESLGRRIVNMESPNPNISNKKNLYGEFQEAVLNKIAGIKGIKTIKSGEGTLGTSGFELVDGVFELKSKIFSVSTFFETGSAFSGDFSDYILDLYKEIKKQTFQTAFLAFNKPLPDSHEVNKALADYKDVVGGPLSGKIIVISGNPNQIPGLIEKKL